MRRADWPELAVRVVQGGARVAQRWLLGGQAAGADGGSLTRSRAWALDVLAAWDRQCAFCGYDGQLGAAPVGLEAAHVRWFTHDGPDDLDNGLALCVPDYKLLDRGALGLTTEGRVRVSDAYTARTEAGRRVYDLHDTELRPRPGPR